MPATPSSPALTVLSDLPARTLPTPQECSAADKASLVGELATVLDGRHPRGLRHPLLPILVLAVWAVMAGACSWAAIADHGADAQADLLEVIGLRHPRWGRPHPATIRRALLGMDMASLEAALRRWALGRRLRLAAEQANLPAAQRGRAAAARTVFSLDGKTARGSVPGLAPGSGQKASSTAATALVSVLDQASGLVLTQTEVVGGDETTAARTALQDLTQVVDLRGCVVTADALHTQRALATWLGDRGGHYLFRVRGNQPRLHAAARAHRWAQVPTQITRDRAHGRVESRSIKVLTLAAGQLDDVFPGAAQVVKIVRRRRALDGPRTRARKKTKTTVETVCYVTSLDYTAADPGLLAAWIRGHWQIENRVHHVRDVTWGEDASGIRTGAGPQVMAALRNTAVNLARLAGTDNIARTARRHARQPATAPAELLAA